LRRKWFGPSKTEIWRQLADEMGARLVEGGFTRGDKVVASHGEWQLTLDTYVINAGNTIITYTRMRAPYVNPDGFRFDIYRKSVFSGLGKLLGMQDIEVGVEGFDEEFIIKANDEAKVRALFANRDIRRLIEGQPNIRLSVKDDEGWFGPSFRDGVDELYFSTPGIIKDVDQLKHLYELFAVTLDQLCEIGSAYETNPRVELR